MEEKNALGDLGVIFPNKKIPMPGGGEVVVHPLYLEDLPKVVNSFSALMKKAEGGVPPSAVAMEGIAEALDILPYCIDRPVSEVPAIILPDILEIVVAQNLSADSLGKWSALIEKVTKYFGMDLQKILSQGKKKVAAGSIQ